MRGCGISWTAEFFADVSGRLPVRDWLEALPDTKRLAMSAAIELILERDGMSLAGRPWLKPLGQGLYEFRVRHSADEVAGMYSATGARTSSPTHAILLRLFVHFHGDHVILLLHGYDKSRDSSKTRQRREIEVARKRLREWRLSGGKIG
jgi:phage-related protein